MYLYTVDQTTENLNLKICTIMTHDICYERRIMGSTCARNEKWRMMPWQPSHCLSGQGGTDHNETISKVSADFVVSIILMHSQISAFVQ